MRVGAFSLYIQMCQVHFARVRHGVTGRGELRVRQRGSWLWSAGETQALRLNSKSSSERCKCVSSLHS